MTNKTSRICKRCKLEGNLDLFVEDENLCKECYKIRSKEYYENNKAKRLIYQKVYYQNNKEEILTYQKGYYQNNKENITIYKKQYYFNNKIIKPGLTKDELEQKQILKKLKRKQINAIYYKNNKESIRLADNKRRKERIKNNLNYRIRCYFSSFINKGLKKNNSSKNGNSCILFLDYTISMLIQNIESKFEWWMTWENQGVYKSNTWDDNNPNTWRWQIDHIIPQSDLPYFSMEDENFKKCWTLSNLRPYSAKQNILDGANRTRHAK